MQFSLFIDVLIPFYSVIRALWNDLLADCLAALFNFIVILFLLFLISFSNLINSLSFFPEILMYFIFCFKFAIKKIVIDFIKWNYDWKIDINYFFCLVKWDFLFLCSIQRNCKIIVYWNMGQIKACTKRLTFTDHKSMIRNVTA